MTQQEVRFNLTFDGDLRTLRRVLLEWQSEIHDDYRAAYPDRFDLPETPLMWDVRGDDQIDIAFVAPDGEITGCINAFALQGKVRMWVWYYDNEKNRETWRRLYDTMAFWGGIREDCSDDPEVLAMLEACKTNERAGIKYEPAPPIEVSFRGTPRAIGRFVESWGDCRYRVFYDDDSEVRIVFFDPPAVGCVRLCARPYGVRAYVEDRLKAVWPDLADRIGREFGVVTQNGAERAQGEAKVEPEKRDSGHYAHSPRKRREIVGEYRRRRGEIKNKHAWAMVTHGISGKTLLAYEREFPESGETRET